MQHNIAILFLFLKYIVFLQKEFLEFSIRLNLEESMLHFKKFNVPIENNFLNKFLLLNFSNKFKSFI